MFVAAVVFVVTLMAMTWWLSGRDGGPPTPGISLPIVGHLYLFKGNPIQQFKLWRKQLGDMYSVDLGSFKFIVLNGYDLVSEALLKHHESLLERPRNVMHMDLLQQAGIVSSGGELWKEQRAFLQSAMRSLGVGRNIMAERIREEVAYLLDVIQATEAKPTDISDSIKASVTNIICGLIFGKRFDIKEKSFVYWIQVVTRLFKLLGVGKPVHFIPALKYLPGDFFHCKEIVALRDELAKTLIRWSDKDKRNIKLTDQEYEDLTQAYLIEIERKKEEGVVSTSLDETHYVSTALGFFNAGSETTANTINFALLYMINYPDIQQRLYEEIKENVGTDRPPEMTDKTKLKFLTAFIMETQRLANVALTGIDRQATEDIYLGGYTIAKGTAVLVNLESILHDEAAWGDPETFRPDRFLSDDGTLVIKKEFIPYGIGKRNCIGASLAQMELFLFISSLVQKFEFQPEDPKRLPPTTPDVGLTTHPQAYKVRAILRKV